MLTLDRPITPYSADGPHNPVVLTLLSSTVLLREIEVAASTVAHLTFDHGAQEMSWLLSASSVLSPAPITW